MSNIGLLSFLFFFISIHINHCQKLNDKDFNGNSTNENRTNNVEDHRRIRRQSDDASSNIDTASAVLSILPLDRIGTMVGQIMSTGLKEMLNPDVGKRILNVLENQAPTLLTSLFTNLMTTLRAPARPSPASSSSSTTNNNVPNKYLTNNSTPQILNVLRRPA